jgi:hypothetical protein
VGSSFNLNTDGQGWKNLSKAVKVRDRLMHPKEVADLQVSNEEVGAAKKAFEWFFISHHLSELYVQKAAQAKTTASSEDVKSLEATIHHMETELAVKDN